MKNLLFSVMLIGILFVVSCKKDEVAVVAPTNEVKFNITLNGSKEAPATTSTATGTFAATYNKDTKIISYAIGYTGVTPTAWHIHKGAVGVAGAVIFGLGTTFTNAYSSVTPALTTEQETDLLAGNYYVNLHSTANPSGDIRGQLVQ
jgi:hypothetical protein